MLDVQPEPRLAADGGESPPAPSGRRLALAVGAVAVVALPLLLLVRGSSDDPDPVATSTSTRGSTASSSPSGLAPGESPAGEADEPAGPSGDAASGADDRTEVAAPAAGGPTVTPAALKAPRAGRYPLRLVTEGTSVDATLVVDGDGWQRRDLGDAGVARVEQLAWDDDGARLVATGIPGEDGACRWEGRSVWIPANLRDGKSWSSRVTCDSTIDGEPVKVVRVERAKVTKRARTQLEGRDIDTWVIEREISVEIRAEGFTTTSDAISTELFAPELGLPVYLTSRTDVPLPDGTIRTVYASEELLGLP